MTDSIGIGVYSEAMRRYGSNFYLRYPVTGAQVEVTYVCKPNEIDEFKRHWPDAFVVGELAQFVRQGVTPIEQQRDFFTQDDRQYLDWIRRPRT